MPSTSSPILLLNFEILDCEKDERELVLYYYWANSNPILR